ncbi:DUF58 domain-containing protein [Candidatus Albibeggiatoa sp. nov. NOAA]|uniref:DUF58 domain-containing protein n=1 Tax=Candidatus Albibeggiatoa sp. nov. NOAA TaxID=3162724 RepID=UPI0032FDB9F4|nr:DUF58 domain-containing protein [Thiotrichaceae bacterium]
MAVVVTFIPFLALAWKLLGFAIFGLALLDGWKLYDIKSIEIQRNVSGSLALGVWSEVTLQLRNPHLQTQKVEIFDDYPPYCEFEALPQTLLVKSQRSVQTHYRIRPEKRGNTQFSGFHLLTYSPLGIWKKYRYIKQETPIKIYPNFAAITKYTLLAMEDRLGQIGIKQLQRRGEGLEFHQLREYRAGDTLRQVDWNASARIKKLISKQYQDERDQQVIFLLDCGRRMWTQDGALSHFDHTLNAMLLLTYVALRQGDAMGLMTFSGQEQRWLAPRKGVNSVNVVLNTVYDLQPSLHTSDYLTAAKHLITRLNKRALIILVSNLRDEDHEELIPAMRLLQKRHLVLVASLQEAVLNQVLDQPVNQFKEALRYAATHEYLHSRRQAHEALNRHGVLYLDTEPEHLPISLVNRYLEIKRSGVL